VKDDIITEVRRIVDTAISGLRAELRNETPNLPAYRIEGTSAWYIPTMEGERYWLRPGQTAGYMGVALAPTAEFWKRPTNGSVNGEGYRVQGTEAIYVLDRGVLRHVEQPDWLWLVQGHGATVLDLPDAHPIWALRA
jgi:hypothetical protein